MNPYVRKRLDTEGAIHVEMKMEIGGFLDCWEPQKLEVRPWPDFLYYFCGPMTKYYDEMQLEEQRACLVHDS